MIRVYPLLWPTKIVAGYGPRGSGFHDAVDLDAPLATPVVAVDNGTVSFGSDPMGGQVAILKSATGPEAYYYAHLSAFVGSDRSVRSGEVIAKSGDTGNAARPDIPKHLHIGLWPRGIYEPGHAPYPDPTADLLAAPHASPPSPRRGWRARDVALVAAGGVALAAIVAIVVVEVRATS